MIIAIFISLGLGALLAFAYYLNQKTPVPEGCENIEAACEGCKVSICSRNPSHREVE